MPQSSTRLFAFWEVQGPRCAPILAALSDSEKWESQWEVRLEDLDGEDVQIVPVEGFAKNWFFDVEPETRYRAELWMRSAEEKPLMMLRSEIVSSHPSLEVGT